VRTALTLTLLALLTAGSAQAASPREWPDRFEIGVSSQPGTAAAYRARAPFGLRYQYLAGGVNTGQGWATWNPGGTFASLYVAESRRARMTPVFTYYQLLQSRPEVGGEAERDLAHLRDPAVMREYYRDFRLALRRAGSGRVVMHVEPDLWGYVQQAARRDSAASVPAAVSTAGDPALSGLPDHAGGFARALVRLRDRIAPNVTLAWHLSVWGTEDDIAYSNPPHARVRALGRRSARFYRSLGTRFDIVFNDVADRDAGFRRKVLGDGGRSAWTPGDFRRHAAYVRTFTRATRTKVALWQIPLGNRSLPDTDRRYRDNRVEWWLGARRRAHLREARRAGIVALLFGAGAEGNTTPQTDGGLFYRLARRYYRAPLRLR
jgi:hypothetical protein